MDDYINISSRLERDDYERICPMNLKKRIQKIEGIKPYLLLPEEREIPFRVLKAYEKLEARFREIGFYDLADPDLIKQAELDRKAGRSSGTTLTPEQALLVHDDLISQELLLELSEAEDEYMKRLKAARNGSNKK